MLAMTNMASLLAQDADTLFVHVGGGCFDAFPRSLVVSEETDAKGTLTLTLADSSEMIYKKEEFDSVSYTGPALPRLASFKFNNKFNDEMPWDVEALFRADDAMNQRILLDVPTITKYLTPSFKTDTEGAVVYVGDEVQESKESRHRFTEDIVYATSLPGCRLARMTEDNVCVMGHYGKDYTVSVDFMTERTTDVPRIEIDVDGGRDITSRSTYRHAKFYLYGNGVYEDMEDSVWIKGRGNSSWSWPKKPYRLKFDEKVSPFGLKKGKSWVLLSNYQTNSMMSNAIGMKAARLAGTKGANHIIPVDLYLNGQYRGSYNFTEKVGIGNNSIDIDEENGGVLLELDQYYDETYKFYSDIYYLPTNVKDPNLSEEPFKADAAERLKAIKNDFNSFCISVNKKTGYEYKMDVDAFARFMMVNDLILNFELGHPKSTYLYNEHIGDITSKWVFGPVWDLDWGYGYENYGRYYQGGSTTSLFSKDSNFGNGTRFFRNLLYNSDLTKKNYYRVWYYFMQESYQELIDYIQDYFDYANPSFLNNAELWRDGYYYEYYLEDIRSWLEERTTWIMNHIEVYDLSEPEPQPYDDVQEVYSNPEECIIVGGEVLSIFAPVPQHIDIRNAAGILILSLDVEAGTTTVQLEPGIYLINNKKILVR
jgi:CotH protein.